MHIFGALLFHKAPRTSNSGEILTGLKGMGREQNLLTSGAVKKGLLAGKVATEKPPLPNCGWAGRE